MKVSLAEVRIPHWQTIVVSFVVAIFLTLVPLPDFLRYARPDWMGLIVIYWVLNLPRHLGVFFGWATGLLHDILSFSLLGLHTLGKALMAAVMSSNTEQVKRFNVIEQILMVFFLQSINIAIIAWVNNLTIGTEIKLVFWQSAISTALLWPFVALVLSRLDPYKS
ncbi:MAG: rod shape-determining protein MreD [Saprospiraceae bacterium]|jgi:rod shape-determining protein MreD